MKDAKKYIPLSEDGPHLPVVDLLTGRGFITGKSGSGKSNTASVIVEELLDRGLACLIVDTDGEYYGLKETYEILHVGADEECDLQVGREHAEKIAELAIQENVPIILDVSGYLDTERGSGLIQDVARYLFTLEKKEKRPFLLLVEEIHEYIPETVRLDDTGKMLIRIAKRGRKRGLGLCGLSQRPADVKKDFITQADWLVWHRLTWENDTEVVRRVVGPEAAELVQDLDDGEAILMADYLEDAPIRMQVRRKYTFDAGATPDLDTFERPDLKSVSSKVVEELEEISKQEQDRQDRVAQLQRKLDQRNTRVAELEEKLDRAEDLSDLAEQLTQALTAQGDTPEAVQTTVEEIREEKKIRQLQEEKNRLEERLKEASKRIEELEEEVETAQRLQHLDQHLNDAKEAVSRLADALNVKTGDDEELRERIQEQREQIAELKQQLEQKDQFTKPKDFLENDAVREKIEEAKREASSPRYVKGVIATLLNSEGRVTYEQIARNLGLQTTSHIGMAVNALEKRRIVEKSREGEGTIVGLDTEGIERIHEYARSQARTEKIMEKMA